VTAYDPSRWSNLFLGELGAAAAFGRGGGCYLLVGATVVAVLPALENSWVLLVEILR